jgi:hypothetical protein
MGSEGRGQRKRQGQRAGEGWETKVSDRVLVCKMRIYSRELERLSGGQFSLKAPTAEMIPTRGAHVEAILGRLAVEAERRLAL